MKKELSTPTLVAVIAAAALFLGGAGWFYFSSVAGAGEPSPELRNKQIEYQKSLIPGGGQSGMPPHQQGTPGGSQGN